MDSPQSLRGEAARPARERETSREGRIGKKGLRGKFPESVAVGAIAYSASGRDAPQKERHVTTERRTYGLRSMCPATSVIASGVI